MDHTLRTVALETILPPFPLPSCVCKRTYSELDIQCGWQCNRESPFYFIIFLLLHFVYSSAWSLKWDAYSCIYLSKWKYIRLALKWNLPCETLALDISWIFADGCSSCTKSVAVGGVIFREPQSSFSATGHLWSSGCVFLSPVLPA